jgi:hypothetical protein
MTASPADIFLRQPELAAFRNSLQALEGDFPFVQEDLIALGEAYFRLFPDRQTDRDLNAVQLGYAIVRVCLIEKAVRGLGPQAKAIFRCALADPARAVSFAREAGAIFPPDAPRRDLAAVEAALDAAKAEIDALPKGLIKERFVGGLTGVLTNLFLIKSGLYKAEGS